MTLNNNTAPLLRYFKLCASFHSHLCIQTGVTIRKQPNLGKIRRFLEPCDLGIWRMTLKNNRVPLLCCFQLCAWFHCHMWIQTGVRVRKRLSWVLTSVTLTFDLWPWPFAWTSLLTMVITRWKFHDDAMIGTWWKRCDRRTDGRTDGLNQSYSCLVAAKNLIFTYLGHFRGKKLPMLFTCTLNFNWNANKSSFMIIQWKRFEKCLQIVILTHFGYFTSRKGPKIWPLDTMIYIHLEVPLIWL